MALKDDLTGLGVAPELAQVLNQEEINAAPRRSVSGNLTATGTTIADALALTAFINPVTTVAASTGVKLPANCPIGQFVLVQNTGANPLNIFPHSSSAFINNGSGGAAVTLAAAGAADICFRRDALNWDIYVLAREA